MNIENLYDIIIIGAGPAGMTAAIYAGRQNKKIALIDKNGFGGKIAASPHVENIPGFVTVSGIDFTTYMYEQVCHLPTITHLINTATKITYKNKLFTVVLDDTDLIVGKSIIFATGTTNRQLNLPTKDIYYCVTCDGPFFKNKDVIVVGSGNSGATYALELATYCNQVYLCDITDHMLCEATLQERIKATANIEWLPNNTISEVFTKTNKLTAVKLSNSKQLKCSAIFAAIGLIPQTDLAASFTKLDTNGYIISNDCTTSIVPGVFVAGDCRTGKYKQVVTATADGATAALEAIKFLNVGGVKAC